MTKFVTEEVCRAKMDDLKDIKGDIKDIKNKVDNHMLHVTEDIALLKGCLKGIKRSIESIDKNMYLSNKSPNGKNGKNITFDKDAFMKIIIIITILVLCIFILIKGDMSIIETILG